SMATWWVLLRPIPPAPSGVADNHRWLLLLSCPGCGRGYFFTRCCDGHSSVRRFGDLRLREEPFDYGVGTNGVHRIRSAIGWSAVLGAGCGRAGCLPCSVCSAYWSGWVCVGC